MLFQEYMRELAQVQLLAPEEEQALWRACKEKGDMKARSRLIESYQPLVFKQARPYCRRPDIMDLVQEGTIGLIEAVERYDHQKGVAFPLYAMHRIRGRIMDFLQREGASDIACLEAAPTEAGALNLKENLQDMTAVPVPEQAEQHELAGRLHTALSRLPEKERAVLEGLYLGRAEPRDMAAGLSVSLAHVYRLRETGVRRVRGMLSRFMKNW